MNGDRGDMTLQAIVGVLVLVCLALVLLGRALTAVGL